jgi:hypothetical protein
VLAFDDIKLGARLRGLDPGGVAEVAQVARFGADALNLTFRVDGRVGERLVYRGEEASFELGEGSEPIPWTPMAGSFGSPPSG